MNDSDDQDKEAFYSRPLSIVQDRPERNVIIVMGDFNAKIGSDNRGYEEIMGQQGLEGRWMTMERDLLTYVPKAIWS